MNIDQEINSSFESSIQRLVVNLFYTSKIFNSKIQKILDPYSIKVQHFNVLRIINGQHPNVVHPGYIKSVMLDKSRDLTRLLDKLVDMEWVNRCTCEQNRRMIDLTMTDLGRIELDKISEDVRHFFSSFDEINSEKLDAVSKGIDELRNHIQKINN